MANVRKKGVTMKKIGILSFSDGRKRVHESLAGGIMEQRDRVAEALEKTGEISVMAGDEIIWNARIARQQAATMNAEQVDGIIFNIPVFAFPNFVQIAATMAEGPFLALSPVHGKLPGLGGLLAAVNLLHQNGIACDKVYGDIEDPEILHKCLVFARASYAVSRIKGQVYGLIGGRSIGMGTGAVNPDLWMRTFGIDVEHVDQLDILRRAEKVDAARVESAFEWLNLHMGSIHYDDDKASGEAIKQQIRCYYATKEIIEEKCMDFVGVKCHYEMSEYYVAQCLSAAFMNDPYDWDGAKEPTVFSCEADSDGALTMQLMKLVSGKPVMFADFRHYDAKDGVFVFCNCGAMATWFAGQSDRPEENLKNVSLYPLIPKYAGKGCHVQYVAQNGAMTLGRLTRSQCGFKMTVFRGECIKFPPEKPAETCMNWPHSYIKVDVDPMELVARYENNHVHGILGDYVDELEKVCSMAGIQCEVIE